MKKLSIQKKAQFTGHNASIYALTLGANAGTFLSAGGDGWVVEWDIENPDLGKLVAKTESQIFSLQHFHHRNLIAAGNMEGGIHWISTKEQVDIKNIAHHEQGIFSILPLGAFALSAGGLGKLTKWNLDRIATQETLHLSSTSLRSIVADEHKIVVGSSDQSIYILDHDLGMLQTIQTAHDNSVFSVALHPNGKNIISGGRDAQLKVWNENGKNIHSQNAHWFTINDIKFNPNGKIFATASRDKTIRIWDAENYTLLKELNTIKNGGHINSVNRLMWLNEQHLLSASDDRSIILWEIE